jgi:hypothetical protein
MPTASELVAASSEYEGNSAFAEGITTDDFTKMLGKERTRVRVWAAYDCTSELSTVGPNGEVVESDGHLYIEQKPNSEILVWRSETKREVYHVDFGLLPQGQTQISNIPDEIEFSYRDRILFVDSVVLGRCLIAPNGEESDTLPRRHITEIVSVIGDGEELSESDFTLIKEASGTSKIEWVNAPQMALITFRYYPEFTWLNASDRLPPRGADGKRLLQRGIATLQQRGEHDE